MKLYSFFNSSASYRVRIALALKGIDYQTVGVNIRIGQQNALAYRRMNPVGLVPTLVTDDGESLGQSLYHRRLAGPTFSANAAAADERPGAQPGAGNCLRYRLRYTPNQ